MIMNDEFLKDDIASIVREAGKIILEAETMRDVHLSKSGHANFVTVYDEKVQEFLIKRLSERLPEARFLAEEEGQDVFRQDYRTGLLFIIDPIDGTSNFMSGYFPYVISVALFKDARPYIGIVYAPVSGQLFSAEAGKGAWLCGPSESGGEKAPAAKRLFVSDRPLGRSLVSFGTSPYNSELSAKTFRLCSEYLPKCIDLRRSGAAAWDLCMVAAGHTGLYFEYSLGIWDYAAGVLIVTEAGGTVRKITGEPLTYDGPSSMLAYGTGISGEDLIFG